MENKCLKTSVYVNENVFSDSCEQPIDVDFTLPDYCPDISKIFKCRAFARISSKGINGKNITVDGSVCITVLYADKDNNLCSYEYQYPFSKIKEMPNECSGANLCCNVKCEYINCRAVTGRKVDIHGAVGINIRVFKRKSNDVISDYDDCNIELRRAVAPATVPMGYSEKYIIIEDEIAISNATAPIQSVLRYDAVPSVKESKIINDKIVVKGDMAVTILYCSEGSAVPQVMKTTLPFSQIVEMQGVTDLCECETKAYLAFLEIKPRMAQNGENRCFSLMAKVLLSCESYCMNDIPVIQDAFSTKFETNIIKDNITFSKICHNIKEICQFKKNVEVSENISSVIDLWCDVQSKSVKFEGSNLIVCATFMVFFVVCDEDNNVSFYEKPIDFEYKFPITETDRPMQCNPDIDITSTGFTITSANTIDLRLDVLVNASVYEKTKMSLITDLEVDKNRPTMRKGKGAMTIYFTNKDECVWDIARTYNASVEDIMNMNDLKDECLKEGTMILVPIV